MHPLRDVRSRLLLIVLVALAGALAVAALVFNLLFAHTTSSAANAFLRQRASSELSLIRVVDGRIRLEETTGDTLGDSRVWIFRGSHPVEVPRVRRETDAAARALVGGPERIVDVAATDERLLAVPIVGHGTRVGTLVAGTSLAPYEQTRRSALIGTLVLCAVLLVLVGLAVWWLLRSALRPVASMTEQAATWSDEDIDRRFGLGPPHDELTRLAATLDGLLDRLAASLRHERRFSAELSHELRTPLAKLMAEAELALRRERGADEYRESLEVVLRNAQQLERIVETLVAAARRDVEPRGVADAFDVAEDVVAACADQAQARGVSLDLAPRRMPLRIGVDRDLAERILHPVVENACRYGESAVRIDVHREGSTVLFAVEDDGPGVAPDERDAIFEPAVRGAAGRTSAAGAGLGLALARRLARGASGDVHADAGPAGRFVVRLPAA